MKIPTRYAEELRHNLAPFKVLFALRHLKIAARFGSQAGEIGDPHLERSLQASALVNAGSQLRIDRFAQALPTARLDSVDIDLGAPQPSVGVARFRPDLDAAHKPRGTRLAMGEAVAGQPECVFLTTQPVAVYPIEITRAKPTGIPADIPALYRYVDGGRDVACIRGAPRTALAHQ